METIVSKVLPFPPSALGCALGPLRSSTRLPGPRSLLCRKLPRDLFRLAESGLWSAEHVNRRGDVAVRCQRVLQFVGYQLN